MYGKVTHKIRNWFTPRADRADIVNPGGLDVYGDTNSKPTMRHLLPTLLLFLLPWAANAQSISGNLNTGAAMDALAYGNVDIYRGDKLVASVLTDRFGNFHVDLDTGLYKCVVSYDGYIATTRMVHVRTDEKTDFAMDRDTSVPLPVRKEKASTWSGMTRTAEEISIGGMVADERMASTVIRGARTTGYLGERPEARSGILTAGEVNDFAKWDLWTDLTETTLAQMRRTWAMAPQGRYAFHLQDVHGLPIADAVVRLEQADGTVLFRSRTDNTGKAELWASLDTTRNLPAGPFALVVSHGGLTQRLDDVQPFQHGVNRMILDVPCGPSNNVDVAFVVDATGSMQDELDFLQAELNEIIYRSKKIGNQLNFRFANVFYRDVGPNEEYLTRTMPFTRVLSKGVNFISAQQADGGGDTPEAVEVALDSAINHLQWSTEARVRIIFLVLDAGPHNTPQVRQRMRELVREASAKGIRIVTVAASGIDKATEYLLRSVALGTNGTYTFLTNHSGVGLPHIEPTTDHYGVESLSGLLARILKSYTYMPDCQQEIPELGLGLPDSLVTSGPDMAGPDSTVAGIAEPGDPSAIRWSYYPNPTTGPVHITADHDIPELYVTDLGGKVLQIIKDLRAGQVAEADLSGYATGIYLIRYPIGDKWLSGKVVLQR